MLRTVTKQKSNPCCNHFLLFPYHPIPICCPSSQVHGALQAGKCLSQIRPVAECIQTERIQEAELLGCEHPPRENRGPSAAKLQGRV